MNKFMRLCADSDRRNDDRVGAEVSNIIAHVIVPAAVIDSGGGGGPPTLGHFCLPVIFLEIPIFR